MKYVPLFYFIFIFLNGNAQKPPIKLDTYKLWTSVTNGALSNDGKFVLYTLINKPTGQNTITIKSTINKWEKQLVNISEPIFSNDSKFVIAKLPTDTILIYNLYSDKVDKIGNADSYKLFLCKGIEYIIITDIRNKQIAVRRLNNTKTINYNKTIGFLLSPNGEVIVTREIVEDGSRHAEKIYWNNIVKNEKKLIYEGDTWRTGIFDDQGNQLAFLTETKVSNSIWIYEKNSNRLIELINDGNNDINQSLKINETNLQFSKDARRLFFSLTDKNLEVDSNRKKGLEIWNFEDAFLRNSYYDSDGNKKRINKYLAVVEIQNKNVKQLLHGSQRIARGNSFNHATDSILVVATSFGNIDEPFINTSKITYSVCNTKTGEITEFANNKSSELTNISVSPNGTFILYYDSELKSYFTYNIKSKTFINVSKNINASLTRADRSEYVAPEIFPTGVAGWLQDESRILLKTTFDFWAVDPMGLRKPINLTKNIGYSNQIVFNLATSDTYDQYKWNQELILTSFNLKTKEIGFFSLIVSDKGNLTKLSEGSFYTFPFEGTYGEMGSNEFSKSRNSKTYLLLKESCTSAPNYYISKDLQNFTMISNNQPQKDYNWLTSELIEYRDSTGLNYSGVLYKPENFDPTKKYPVIILIYEKQTNLLNSFPSVELPSANFSITTAVSNGYLVFLPDIISKVGYAGEAALNSILAAENALSKFQWIDSDNIAIAGHSYGGFETNYILSHSNKFKCALSCAGVSDFISMAYELWGDDAGISSQSFFEYSTPKMGKAFALDASSYLRNSVLFNAKSINTPLLLLHNKLDEASPFRQSRQLYLLLRSLKKQVWWLNYLTESHGIADPNNKLDYNTKVLEFFDHFLKGKPKPSWMLPKILPQ